MNGIEHANAPSMPFNRRSSSRPYGNITDDIIMRYLDKHIHKNQ